VEMSNLAYPPDSLAYNSPPIDRSILLPSLPANDLCKLNPNLVEPDHKTGRLLVL
jgi:hypothetical protein